MPDNDVKTTGAHCGEVPAKLRHFTTKCRSCGAPVLFATNTNTHRTMILNAAPVKGGNVAVYVHGGQLRATVGGAARSLAELHDRHVTHFATCPQADSWRHKGPGESHD